MVILDPCPIPLITVCLEGLPPHGCNLLHNHSLDVPLPHHLLGLQPQRRVVGNERGAEEEDSGRAGAGINRFLGNFINF